jgi:hypothetical protein
VIRADEPRRKMMLPRNPEPREWKVNGRKEQEGRIKVSSEMLLEKYVKQQRVSVFRRLRGIKRERSLKEWTPRSEARQVEPEGNRVHHKQQVYHGRSVTAQGQGGCWHGGTLQQAGGGGGQGNPCNF